MTVHDARATELDRGADELFRTSCALAVENRRFLMRNPNKRHKFGQEGVDAVFSAFEEASKNNYILGEYGNPEEWVESNANVWVSCGRHQGYYTFGTKSLNELLLSRATRLFENRPISFAPAPGAGPSF